MRRSFVLGSTLLLVLLAVGHRLQPGGCRQHPLHHEVQHGGLVGVLQDRRWRRHHQVQRRPVAEGQAVGQGRRADGGQVVHRETATASFPQSPARTSCFGTYVAAEAHAGAVKSSGAQVMTKGEVSLALSGTGRGFDLGVAFGAMTISR